VPPPILPPFPTRRSSDLIVSGGLNHAAEHVPLALIDTARKRPAARHAIAARNARGASGREYVGRGDQRPSRPAPDALLAFDRPRSEEHTSELQSLRHLVC